MAQTVENLPAMQETQVQSLGCEDPLEEGHSSILAWRIPKDGGSWRATCSQWGHQESDMTERLSKAQHMILMNVSLRNSV